MPEREGTGTVLGAAWGTVRLYRLTLQRTDTRGTMTGRVSETYLAALQHDLVDLDGATPVGVVRQPTRWFHGVIEENYRDLGPPDPLLTAIDDTRDELAIAGLCDEEAHNAAWQETDFEERYRSHLNESEAADDALTELRERVRDGEDIALVCFEADDKRCHRHTLREILVQGL